MKEFRWITKVLSGPWFVTRNLAMLNAVHYGQATVNEGSGAIITLHAFASIEERNTEN